MSINDWLTKFVMVNPDYHSHKITEKSVVIYWENGDKSVLSKKYLSELIN